MSNFYFLRDGRNFLNNPELEADPDAARKAKKAFLLTINSTDLTTDKLWTVEAIRALATGLVPVKADKKRLNKQQLVESLQAYIQEEKALVLVSAQDILLNLKECGYNPEELLKMLSNMHGLALVNEVEKSILLNGYAPTTIVKTVMPDVVKLINSHYQGEDRAFVISELRRKFSSVNKDINEATRLKVAKQNNERRPVYYKVLADHVESLALRIDELSWKELSVCLAFATGRRMAEVHGSATILEMSDVPGAVRFSGQLKTKGRGDVGSYDILTLLAPDDVIRMHQRLKDLGKADFSPEDVHRKLSKPLSSELPISLREVFKKAGVTQYKDLRDIYASKISELRPANMTDVAFISKYLGHGENDISTALTYQKLYLVLENHSKAGETNND